MDKIASAKWVSELEMEDPVFLNHYRKNPADFSIEDLNFLSFSFESYSSYPNFFTDHKNGTDQIRPAKQPKNNYSNLDSCTKTNLGNASSFASSVLISFDNSNSSPLTPSQYQHDGIHSAIPVKLEMGSYRELKLNSKDDDAVASQTYPPKHGKGIKRPAARSPLHAQEHVIAEKKRRQNLNQQFITLSAVLPGLKKNNKSSVLEEATEYVKHLKEQMKILEEQAVKKTVQSVRRTQYSSGDDNESSLDESSAGSCSDRRPPEIEARFLDGEVLIRIGSTVRKRKDV